MSRIRGRDTRPEMLVRRALHAAGRRYRLHARGLPGRPDLVFPGPRAVIFVHGCFWHGHDCPHFRWPATRPEFWEAKVGANRARDAAAVERLRQDGWRVMTLWECALRGRGRLPMPEVTARLMAWLDSDVAEASVRGEATRMSDI